MKLSEEYILRTGAGHLIIKESRTEYGSNREFKDGMFRLLFSEKKAALELLNALEGTGRQGEEKIEIDTLRDALYKRRLNDLAFRYDFSPLSIVEHMSAWSENMPIRELSYVGRVYEKILPGRELYREARCEIPVPRLYVLYNGIKDKPLETIQRLSDAFVSGQKKCKNDPMLELAVRVININYHKGHPVLERSPTLKQYAQFVQRVRTHMKRDKMSRDEAIQESIASCIKDGILEEFLRKHGSEVNNMMLTDITLEEFVDIRVEEAEERVAEEKDRQFVTKLLRQNWEIDKIQELTEVPADKILEIAGTIEMISGKNF